MPRKKKNAPDVQIQRKWDCLLYESCLDNASRRNTMFDCAECHNFTQVKVFNVLNFLYRSAECLPGTPDIGGKNENPGVDAESLLKWHD